MDCDLIRAHADSGSVNTQAEFDRSYRSTVNEPGYQGKNLVFIAGLNIDISPEAGQLFPLTKFVPWAAYVKIADGTHRMLEQQQPDDNPDRIDLEDAIHIMEEALEVHVHTPQRPGKG